MRISQILSTTALVILWTSSSVIADDNMPKWAPQLELETDLGVGHDSRDIGLPKMMVPLWQDDRSLLFTDLRYRFDNEQSQEYNIGLGFRREINNNWILGGYGFFDKLSSPAGNLYSQGTFGLEALSVMRDARLNVYIPETTRHQLGTTTSDQVVVSGSQIFFQDGLSSFERALPGEDFEYGQKLPFDFADIRVYGGAYRYTAEGFGMEAGPRARLEVTLNDSYVPSIPFGAEVTVGGEIENDQIRGTEGFGVIKLRIPFGGSTSYHKDSDALDARMNKFIERDIDIITKNGSSGGAKEIAEINGIAVTNIAQVTAGNNFDTVINNTPSNSLILVSGNSSTSGTYALAIMKANQIILGGGSTIAVTGVTSGRSADYTAPGTHPTISNGGLNMVNVNNVMLQDVDFTNTIGGIDINSASNAILRNITLNSSSANSAGISIGAQNVLLSNVTVNMTGGTSSGIFVGNTSGLTLSHVTSTATNIGINFFNPAQNTVLSDSTFTGNNYGVSLNGATLTNMVLNNVQASSASNDFYISNTTGTGLTGAGNTATGSGTHCRNAGGNSITGSFTYNGNLTCP